MLRYPIRSFIYGFNNKLIRIEEKLVSLRRARNEPLQSSSSVRMELFSYDTPAESIVIDKREICVQDTLKDWFCLKHTVKAEFVSNTS